MCKLSALFVSFLCFCISSVAQTQDDRVKLPDFAYPQDVIKTAEEMIKSSNGGERVLGALELWKAKNSIDWMTRPESLKIIESVADEQDNPATKALLKLMAAELGKLVSHDRTQVNIYMNGEGTF
ncbi:MAG: hypothetical protein K2K84_07695, partial [Muribaculaceae bacterium]|nr:hypothetical protein [Muribaculaceae bacterium]